MHNVKSILIGLLIGIVMLIGISISVSLIYEEDVSQYLIEELNEHLTTEIKVEQVNFSLLKKFPKASLEFKNVVAFSKEGYFEKICGLNTDTLFYAEHLYVNLNILDIITKNYIIKSIHLDKGNVNLFIDRFGDPNYIFWESKAENNDEFSLELQEVRVTNSNVAFCNEATRFIAQTYVNRLNFKGNFSNKNYLLKIKSDIKVNNVEINEIKYLDNNNLLSDIELDIINKKIRINQGDVKLNNLKFIVGGEFETTEKQNNIDIVVSGNNLNIKTFMATLPDALRNEFPNISAQKGQVTLNIAIAGEDIKTKNPHIGAMFLIQDAQLFDEERLVRLQNINIDGEFTNGANNSLSSSKLIFKNFNTNLESSYFEGSLEMENLKEPILKSEVNADLFFDELKEVFAIDTFDILKGFANTKLIYNGSYNNLKSLKLTDIFTSDYELELKLKQGEFKLKNNPIWIKEISGNFDVRNSLYTDSLYFKINENDFLIHGRISKLYEYFNEKQMFNVNASLESRKINLNELAPLFKVDKSQNQNSSYQFPEKIALQLRLDVQNFEVGKFNATNIKGNLNYKPKMFSLHQIAFNSMGGYVKAGGVIIQKFDNDFVVKSQSRLTDININKLFYSFNNFGQQFITNQNLQGNLTGDVFFNSEWSDKIEIYKKTVNADCDIVLTNGELNDFEPMLALSKFIEVDELKSIKFSTLKNQIEIKDEKIIIPQMDISSSVLDVTASGEHNFDNSYSYHVKLLLSDLLSGKMKKSKRDKNIENAEEDDQGRVTLYLLLKGDKDDFKVRYDRKQARAARKEGMSNEKRELKKILNEEFGWFKKDSALNSESKTKKDNQGFKVEFEEKRNTEKKKEDLNNQKFKIEWDEDTTQTG